MSSEPRRMVAGELVSEARHTIEPVQLLYVLMFSVSLIHMDRCRYLDISR